VDRYLTIDAVRAVPGADGDVGVDGAPYYLREVGWDTPRVMGTDELFLQMLEAATR